MWIKSNDEYVLVWNSKEYQLNKGISEIPNEVADAYFFTDTLKRYTSDEELLARITSVILQRWDAVIAKKGKLKEPTTIDFILDNFVWSETREGLEPVKKDK
jgi:hypothetical protein